MVSKSKFSSVIPDIIAGTVNGIIIIVSAMALAALVFTGPLAEFLPQGIGGVYGPISGIPSTGHWYSSGRIANICTVFSFYFQIPNYS